MKLVITFIFLGATVKGKAWEDNRLEKSQQVVIKALLEVHDWGRPLLKGGTDWFSLSLGRIPGFLNVFLEKLAGWGQSLPNIFFLTQRSLRHLYFGV